MKRYKKLWDEFISKENFEKACHNAQLGKKNHYGVILFNRNPVENLEHVRQSVITGTFRTSEYRSRKIYEPKERTIYMLPFMPDRIVQHALMNVLIPCMEKIFIAHSYACITGKGSLKAAQTCSKFVRRNKYALKCDIRKFYPSIDHEILSAMYHRTFKEEKLLKIIDDIIFSFPGGKNCPIGNYVSQWSGNFYLTALDNFVKRHLKCRDYLRYCDDFILFSDNKKYLHDCRIKIEKFLKDKLKLEYSRADVFATKQGVDFCGYRMFGKFVLLRKSTALRMKRKVKKIQEKDKISDRDKSVIASIKGWMKHANTGNLRKSMNI